MCLRLCVLALYMYLVVYLYCMSQTWLVVSWLFAVFFSFLFSSPRKLRPTPRLCGSLRSATTSSFTSTSPDARRPSPVFTTPSPFAVTSPRHKYCEQKTQKKVCFKKEARRCRWLKHGVISRFRLTAPREDGELSWARRSVSVRFLASATR